MAIVTLAGLRSAYNSSQRISAQKIGPDTTALGNSSMLSVGHIWDYFRITTGYPFAGVAPIDTTGTYYNKSSTGAIFLPGTAAGTQYLLADVQAVAQWLPRTSAAAGTTERSWPIGGSVLVHVYDRIWANTGINARLTSTQSFTPPTLPRYTDGVGLSLWLCWLSSFTPNNVNATVVYTNQSGSSVTVTAAINAFQTLAVHNPIIHMMPLGPGDTGIRTVSSITFSGASVDLTPNTLGLMIVKYLGCYRASISSEPTSTTPLSLFSGLPSFDGNACLSLAVQAPGRLAASGTSDTIFEGSLPDIALEARVLTV